MEDRVHSYHQDDAAEEIRLAEHRRRFLDDAERWAHERGRRKEEKRHWTHILGRRNIRGGKSGSDVAALPRGDIASWRASDTDLITLEGARVTSWKSRTGFANIDATAPAGSAQRPTWNASDVRFGNQPSITFASSQWLDLVGTTTDLVSGSIIAHVAIDTIGSNRTIISDFPITKPTGGASVRLYGNAAATLQIVSTLPAPQNLGTVTTWIGDTAYLFSHTWTAAAQSVRMNALAIATHARIENMRRLPRGTMGQEGAANYLVGSIHSLDIYSYAVF